MLSHHFILETGEPPLVSMISGIWRAAQLYKYSIQFGSLVKYRTFIFFTCKRGCNGNNKEPIQSMGWPPILKRPFAVFQ
jgi:hypothetical protein